MHSKPITENLKIGALNCHGLKEKIDYPEFSKLIGDTEIFG